MLVVFIFLYSRDYILLEVLKNERNINLLFIGFCFVGNSQVIDSDIQIESIEK